MAIRKRGNSYQIDYIDPNGKRVRKSFSKKKEAEAELGKRVSLIAENRYLDVKKDYKTTLKELLEKYEENFKHQASFYNGKISASISGKIPGLPISAMLTLKHTGTI
jgi:hypothetical protein